MAQGDLWQMGVALNVLNPSFRKPAVIETTLGANLSNLAQSSPIDCSISGANGWQPTVSRLDHYLKPTDIVVVGPSSHSTAVDTVFRTAVDWNIAQATYDNRVVGNTFIVGNIKPAQALAGDPVAFICRGMPAGWHPYLTDSADFGKVYMWPIDGMAYDAAANYKGYDDVYHLHPQLTDSRAGEVQFRAAKDPLGTAYLNSLEPSTVYKVHCFYKYLGAGLANIPYLQLKYDGSVVAQAALGSGATWTEISGTGTSSSTRGATTTLWFTFPAAVTGAHYQLDCVAVCHSAETDDASSGIWTMDEYPEDESIRPSQRNQSQGVYLPNQSLRVSWPGGDDVKWKIGCQFRNVSQSMFDNLRILNDWQKRGNHLILRTFLDDLPPFLYGVMSMTVGWSTWDKSKHDIEFEFTEV